MSIDLIARLQLIDELTAPLRKATDGMGNAEKATGKLSGAVKTATGVLAAFGVALGAATAVKAIVGIGVAFDSQMSKVQAVSGATTEEFDKLRQTAKDLGASTSFSAGQAAEGMEYLALAGFKTNDIISAMPGMLDLAAAGALELGRAADIVSDTMSAFGIKSDQATHAADVFAYAQANANTNVEQMGEAMKYAAPVTNSFGWSLEQTAAAQMALADAGIKGSLAGQAFGSSLTRLAEPTKKMSGVMNKLGIEMFDANGTMKSMPDVVKELEKGTAGLTDKQKASALSTMFGATAYKHWAILLEEGSESLANMTTELENSDGAAAQMAETMLNNLGGKWTIFMSAMEGVALTIYEKLEPALSGIVEKLTDFASKVPGYFDQFMEIWPLLRDGIVAAGTALLVFKGYMVTMSIIGVVTKLLKAQRAATLHLTLAQMGLNAAFWLSPTTWVVAGIVALIAIGYVLIKNWDLVKEKTLELWSSTRVLREGILDMLGPIGFLIRFAVDLATNWDSTKSVWENVWSAMKNSAIRHINSIVDKVNWLIEKIKLIPGVNVPLVANISYGPVTDQAKVDSSSALKRATGSDPIDAMNATVPKPPKATNGAQISPLDKFKKSNFSNGLARVKSASMPATIHYDEAVLTAAQSNMLRNSGVLSNSGDRPVVNMDAFHAMNTGNVTNMKEYKDYKTDNSVQNYKDYKMDNSIKNYKPTSKEISNTTYQTKNNQQTHTAIEKATVQERPNINIAKLADTIVVREEADVDKFADAHVRKLIEAYELGAG